MPKIEKSQREVIVKQLDAAVYSNVISQGERRLVYLWWTEADNYKRFPSIGQQDGWRKRESRAYEIIDLAAASVSNSQEGRR